MLITHVQPVLVVAVARAACHQLPQELAHCVLVRVVIFFCKIFFTLQIYKSISMMPSIRSVSRAATGAQRAQVPPTQTAVYALAVAEAHLRVYCLPARVRLATGTIVRIRYYK